MSRARLPLSLSLALASLWHRKKILALVTLTLTLSVALLFGVQYLRTEVRQSFTNTVTGTDLIIGARSGELNLLLYSVFHIGDATNNVRWSTFEGLQQDPRIDWLVPLSMGDSYRGHRVIGTDAGFLRHYQYGNSESLEMASGHWFEGVFDAVIGAEVARSFGHRTGDDITLSHGGGRTSFLHHDDHPFTITGILAPTGTPVDRAVYISLEGLEAIHIGWESGVPLPGRTIIPERAMERDLTPKSITAALAGIERRVLTFQVQRDINQHTGEPLSAILPGVALSQLWQVLGQFERALFGITLFVVIISFAGLLAVLLTLQSHRQQEIAVLRATGAHPGLVTGLYILECAGLAILSTLLAVALWYLALTLARPVMLEWWGLVIPSRLPDRQEILLLGAVPVAGALTGLIPAWQAWRSGNRHFGWGGSGS